MLSLPPLLLLLAVTADRSLHDDNCCQHHPSQCCLYCHHPHQLIGASLPTKIICCCSLSAFNALAPSPKPMPFYSGHHRQLIDDSVCHCLLQMSLPGYHCGCCLRQLIVAPFLKNRCFSC